MCVEENRCPVCLQVSFKLLSLIRLEPSYNNNNNGLWVMTKVVNTEKA